MSNFIDELKIFKDFKYIEKNGKIGIAKYTGTEKYIEIPSYIEEKPVVAILDISFSSKALTGVKLPDTIISIGSLAFAKNNLEDIEFPKNLGFINLKAFSNNKLDIIKVGNRTFNTNATNENFVYKFY